MNGYVTCAHPRNAPPGPSSGPEWHCHDCGYWNPALGRDDRATFTCRTCGAEREREEAASTTATSAYKPRQWRIVFDLAGRDEGALRDAVERVLCGPEHPDGPGDECLIAWMSMSPGDEDGS